MKIILKCTVILIIFLNLLIVLSGKTWLYKAISITYLKGHTSSYISDYIHFPSVDVENGAHQEWLISSQYNQKNLPKYIQEINDSLETTAFLVIKNDSILFEKYWHGYTKDSSSNSFSIAKSWVASLIGIAINEGKIKNVNQKVCDFLPEFCSEKEKSITIKHLLTMSSGLDWEESYYNPLGKTSEAYYGRNLKDLVIKLKSIEEPGKFFKYHSANTQILAFLLEEATGYSINEYLSEKMWKVLGADHPALWNTDVQNGDEKAFCCINSNARNFARLGKLYLNYGQWNGIQMIDSIFIKNATSAAELLNKEGILNTNYGYHFWIADRYDYEIFYARGLWGQYIICIPDLDMIIVRLGRRYGSNLSDGHHYDFYKFVEAAIELYK